MPCSSAPMRRPASATTWPAPTTCCPRTGRPASPAPCGSTTSASTSTPSAWTTRRCGPLGPHVVTLADTEGLPAHAQSVRLRWPPLGTARAAPARGAPRPRRARAATTRPQVDVDVRLNTNESPLPPPEAWLRRAGRRRRAASTSTATPTGRPPRCGPPWPSSHGVGIDEVFCANGSNEVLQCLLLAYGGTGPHGRAVRADVRPAPPHRPVTGTRWLAGPRRDDFALDLDAVAPTWSPRSEPGAHLPLLAQQPDRRADAPEEVADGARLAAGPAGGRRGLRAVRPVVGARRCAAGTRPGRATSWWSRTFSKTWSMAGARLGYLVADPEVVAACELVALPYHLDAAKQAAGSPGAALRRRDGAAGGRHRRGAGPDRRRLRRPARRDVAVGRQLPAVPPAGQAGARRCGPTSSAPSVLVRDCSTWPGLTGCLRVTVGPPEENDRFLAALTESLR